MFAPFLDEPHVLGNCKFGDTQTLAGLQLD